MTHYANWKIWLLLVASSLLLSCAKDHSKDDAKAVLPAVPAAWYQTPDAKLADAKPSEKNFEPPSPELTASVYSAFRAHSLALENLPKVTAPARRLPVADHPSDWTPWHLDGMIGAFGIDVGGVFGAVIADGSPSVKITWQKQSAQPEAAAQPKKQTPYRFNSKMSAADVSKMLEPAVHAAAATKSVKNVKAFRRNLNSQGMKFLEAAKYLNRVKPVRGWHIAGFQLGLFFTLSGEVVPAVGLGGTVSLIFDFETSGSNGEALVEGGGRETETQKNMADFVQTLVTLIPEARAESADIRKAGFEFSVFQIGLGVGVGGDIGIASASGSVVGRIVFKLDEAAAASEPAPTKRSKTVKLVAAPKPGASTGVIYEVEANKFRNGIKKAIEMGSFFAQQAVKADTANWKTTEIELAFDTAIGGDLNLTTIAGIGLIRMAFERVEP
jgi:hypothetical protein